MGIIFDSRDALLVGTAAPTVDSFGVLRDWRGHESHDLLIDQPKDLSWDSSDHVATTLNPGPYPDLDNAINYVSGTDSLSGQLDVLADAHDEQVEFGSWVKLDELPTVVSETEISFIKLTNTISSAFLEVAFLLQSNGNVQIRARYYTGTLAVVFDHPDLVDTTDWTFISVHFHHYLGGGSSPRIYIDPGNDNQLPGATTYDIPAGTYDLMEVCEGNGVGPGNLKGIQFADLMLLRQILDAGEEGGVDTPFTTPGSEATFIVPAGVTSIVATMWSAGGGSGGGGDFVNGFGGHGGGSGFTKATHAVTPGESLGVWVGGGGGLGIGSNLTVLCGEGAGGGAASAVWRGTAMSGTLLQTTGGGAGGGGGDNSSAVIGGNGGAGGANTGVTGTNSGFALGGVGGSQIAGGAGGTGRAPGDAGASMQGGDGADGHATASTAGGAANAGSLNGGAGGSDDVGGFAGGGAGGSGFFGGGGGSCSVASDAGGGGGGGGSNFIIGTATATTSSQGVGRLPAGSGDPLHTGSVGRGADAERFLDGLDGANGFDGKTVLSYFSASWRQQIRDYTTHVEFDSGVVDRATPVRYYRGTEIDLGGGLGDRFVHSIAGFLNIAIASGGVLDRNVGVGPISGATNSYRYQSSCTGVTTLHYAVFADWEISQFVFFKQPAAPTSDGDWFIRFENDAGEYVQLERDGANVRIRAEFSDTSVFVSTLAANPLLNESWHRLVLRTSDAAAWIVGIDGTNYLVQQPASVLSLSAPMTRVRFGNIDVNLALLGYANYWDSELLSTFTTQTTEAAIRTYIQARTDAVPAGPDYYCGYLPMQDTEIGDA